MQLKCFSIYCSSVMSPKQKKGLLQSCFSSSFYINPWRNSTLEFYFGKNKTKNKNKKNNPFSQLCASKLKGFTVISYVLQCYLFPRRHRAGGFQPTDHSSWENDTHTRTHTCAHTHTHTKVFLISVYSAVGSKLPALAKKAQHESEVLKKEIFFYSLLTDDVVWRFCDDQHSKDDPWRRSYILGTGVVTQRSDFPPAANELLEFHKLNCGRVQKIDPFATNRRKTSLQNQTPFRKKKRQFPKEQD